MIVDVFFMKSLDILEKMLYICTMFSNTKNLNL